MKGPFHAGGVQAALNGPECIFSDSPLHSNSSELGRKAVNL